MSDHKQCAVTNIHFAAVPVRCILEAGHAAKHKYISEGDEQVIEWRTADEVRGFTPLAWMISGEKFAGGVMSTTDQGEAP